MCSAFSCAKSALNIYNNKKEAFVNTWKKLDNNAFSVGKTISVLHEEAQNRILQTHFQVNVQNIIVFQMKSFVF